MLSGGGGRRCASSLTGGAPPTTRSDWLRTGSIGAQGAMGTGGLVVKYLDPSKTDISESTWLLCFH